jgi:topoisomerase-4 subunit A
MLPIKDKTYIGQTKYLFIYNKEQVFSILYHDKKTGTWYAKRFQVGACILEKEYHVVPDGCVIDALYTNAGVVVSLELPVSRRRAQNAIEVDFDSLPMRGREARGFKVTSYPVLKITITKRGGSSPENPEPSEPSESPEPADSPESPEPPENPEPPERPEKPGATKLHQDELPFFLDEQ